MRGRFVVGYRMPTKAPPRLNRAWHEAHRMPPKATLEERIFWHQAHAANCACRPTPLWIADELRRAREGKPQTRASARTDQPSRSRRRTGAKPAAR